MDADKATLFIELKPAVERPLGLMKIMHVCPTAAEH
jgi:hypothetical protein